MKNKRRSLSEEHKKKIKAALKKYYETHDASFKGKHHSEETKRKIGEGNKGQYHSEITKKKISETKRGHTVSARTREKLSKANKGRLRSEESKQKHSEWMKKNNPMKGKHLSAEHKRKLRLSAIERIKNRKGQCIPGYNPKACQIFGELNIKNNWELQHAENGGEFHIKELGYWPDAIDFKNKIIIEYDEARHFKNGKLRKKDVQRQKEIEEKYPDFEFIRIKE